MTSKNKNKSSADLRQELQTVKAAQKYKNTAQIIGGIVSISQTLIPYSALVGCFYFIYLIAETLSGETTLANIGLNILADVKISETIAWLFAGGGVLYGVKENRQKKKAIQHLKPRTTELEKILDPNRTTSYLTERGETNPEDN